MVREPCRVACVFLHYKSHANVEPSYVTSLECVLWQFFVFGRFRTIHPKCIAVSTFVILPITARWTWVAGLDSGHALGFRIQHKSCQFSLQAQMAGFGYRLRRSAIFDRPTKTASGLNELLGK